MINITSKKKRLTFVPDLRPRFLCHFGDMSAARCNDAINSVGRVWAETIHKHGTCGSGRAPLKIVLQHRLQFYYRKAACITDHRIDSQLKCANAILICRTAKLQEQSWNGNKNSIHISYSVSIVFNIYSKSGWNLMLDRSIQGRSKCLIRRQYVFRLDGETILCIHLNLILHSVNPVFLHCLSVSISWIRNLAPRSQRECQWCWYT